jgi:Na+/H+ antiporter NhaC
MSSAGAQCDHLNHVSTQLPYAITVAAISFVNFIIASYIQNAIISLAIAVVMTIGVLVAIKFITKKKA